MENLKTASMVSGFIVKKSVQSRPEISANLRAVCLPTSMLPFKMSDRCPGDMPTVSAILMRLISAILPPSLIFDTILFRLIRNVKIYFRNIRNKNGVFVQFVSLIKHLALIKPVFKALFFTGYFRSFRIKIQKSKGDKCMTFFKGR